MADAGAQETGSKISDEFLKKSDDLFEEQQFEEVLKLLESSEVIYNMGPISQNTLSYFALPGKWGAQENLNHFTLVKQRLDDQYIESDQYDASIEVRICHQYY